MYKIFNCSLLDAEPIGESYVEELPMEEGMKVRRFKCKLCKCEFNDVVTYESHVRGRRHRLNYKVHLLVINYFYKI